MPGSGQAERASLRNEPKAYIRQVVDRFNLQKALADEGTVSSLRMAGYRGQAPLFVFLFARLVLPLLFFGIAASISSFCSTSTSRHSCKFLFAIAFAYIGFYRARSSTSPTSFPSGRLRSGAPGRMRSTSS